MKNRIALFLFLFTTIAPVVWAETLKSEISDQTGVEVTVYNSNLGLVKDTRKLTLAAGEGELRFADVASQIQPVTVRARSLSKPDGFEVLEQNYEFDLMDHSKVLDKYVGKQIKIVDWNEHHDRKTEVEATLLSNEGQIYRIGDEIYLGHPGYKVVPEIPENLIAKPTLTWTYKNSINGPQDLEVSYLTAGLQWEADYVAVLDQDDATLDLSGWVSLTNQSGVIFKNAKLKLVAGDVHRAAPAQPVMMKYAMAAQGGAERDFVEQAFFEYHIYDLQRRTTIKDNQTKQIRLLSAAGAKSVKTFVLEGQQYYFIQKYWDNNPKEKIKVFVEFVSSQANKLGMPLPAGVVRLYKKDADGSLQFAGEDRIEHTPKDEKIRLEIGEAFDVVAERVQTDYKQITSVQHETEWEITLRNHKDSDITVAVLENVPGSWKILSNSHPFKKESAFAVRFEVPVPKNGETKVKYRVRTGI